MTTDASAQLLSQLRDIQGAPEAPFWPPAPGWWILALCGLALLAWTFRALRRRNEVRRRRRDLVDRLARLRDTVDPEESPQAWLAGVNRLLKVTAMRAFPEQEPGVLAGADWAAFLGAEAGADAGAESFTALVAGPYEPHPEFDPVALEAAAEAWLRRHG
ncbi:MAG: DUF4381 domain-containing protein [Xanthomonadales bacterium]|jgi:hypothetical protein|nr:DUF4381 domain-containing protein [Xanthomonadales bacterium]